MGWGRGNNYLKVANRISMSILETQYCIKGHALTINFTLSIGDKKYPSLNLIDLGMTAIKRHFL